jgi:hypothetical protein
MKTRLNALVGVACTLHLLCFITLRAAESEPEPLPPAEDNQELFRETPPDETSQFRDALDPAAAEPPSPPADEYERSEEESQPGREGMREPTPGDLPETFDNITVIPAPPAQPQPERQTIIAPRDPPSNEPVELRFNFRGAPLEMVLNYLSEAAGFVIVLETDVKGKVDMWSNQPLDREEAVELLNGVLTKNGYTALRNGRTLTIVSRDDARRRNIPVHSGGNPTEIPQSDEIVTQIIPVRYISAAPLARDLQPLLAPQATLSANEGGNALVLTDTQNNIRRMAEIVRALDTAIASVSAVRVFSLEHADAKSLATVINQLFAPQQEGGRNLGPGAARFMNFVRGGGGGQNGNSVDLTGGRAPTVRVVAVADEHSNSVVVNAPEEQIPVIEDLVRRVDTSVQDVTELRVFRLRYADPQEMADLLTDLFPDETTSQTGGPGQIQFGGRFGGNQRGGANRNNRTDSSARLQKQNRVLAVPDLRTGSVVVSAARDLLDQITGMIEALDADPARKQKVFVFPVENTDPAAVQEILQNLFPDQNYNNGRGATGNRNSTANRTSALNNRANNAAQNQGMNTGFGTTGTGRAGNTGGVTGR